MPSSFFALRTRASGTAIPAPPPRSRPATLLALTILALAFIATLSACAAIPAAAPAARVIDANADATQRITAAYHRDLDWLRAHLAASLDQQRTILLGRLHRSLIEDDLLTPAGPNPDAIAQRLNDPHDDNPLIAEIRAARLTRAEAERFLADYAIAASMSGPASRALRSDMLASLAPAAEHDRRAGALLHAFDLHAATITTLLDELNAGHDALGYTIGPATTPARNPAGNRSPASHPEATTAPTDAWLPLLERIADPTLRAAAQATLADILHRAP